MKFEALHMRCTAGPWKLSAKALAAGRSKLYSDRKCLSLLPLGLLPQKDAWTL